MLSYAPLMADDLCWWTKSRVVGLRFHYPTSPERHKHAGSWYPNMTNIFADSRRVVLAAIEDLVANRELPAGLDLRRVAVEPPRDPAHGDLATNAAMVLAGAVRENPMTLAERIGAALAGRAMAT